ncbi:MAG: SpoIIE family protein phosphatase [Nitrososphaerales archaeon]
MLDLSDIHHLPALADAVEQLIAEPAGLVLIAGLDVPVAPTPAAPAAADPLPLPSGRSSLFRMVARRLLARTKRRAVIIASGRDMLRVRRDERRRVDVVAAGGVDEVRSRLLALAGLPPELIVLEKIEDAQVATAALQLVDRGSKVLAQIDTPFRGLGLVRELIDDGGDRDLVLRRLTWVFASQRVPALCPTCLTSRPVDPLEAAELRSRFPAPIELPRVAYEAKGCARCDGSGRLGEVTLFDIYRPVERRTVVSYEMYALQLARDGLLTLDDVLSLEASQVRHAHALKAASEAALREANASLQRKVAELESAHRVSAQRTEALVSLQRMTEVLLSDAPPVAMARHICQQARELCGADRAVLYAVMDGQARVLSEAGWGAERLPGPLPVEEVCAPIGDTEASARPVTYDRWPPGIPWRTPDVEGAALRAGVRVLLIAQGETVGALYVHTTVRTSFAPGHLALLQTLAAHAALALQRAGLTAALRAKVAALEAAQAELAVKARMARELELARQVQQSFLPRTFPQLARYAFAAHNEPAREVGGDFYDVIDLGDGRVGLVIADVSDKGMAAALYMALSRSLIRAEATRESSPVTVLANVNRLLLELGEQGMFVTVFYAVLDTRSGCVAYARAGHDRPLLLRGDNAQLLDGKGLLLGTFEGIEGSLTEHDLKLLPGDRLVLYTDGLTDVVNAQGELLGLERLTGLLQRHAELPAQEMCLAITRDLDLYRAGAEQPDDMTLLVVAAS